MEKVCNSSYNIKQDNVDKLLELFPEIESDGKINFDVLKQLLIEKIDTEDEKYGFIWNGKSSAKKQVENQSLNTLLPCKEKSINWNKTENVYIEGDNLEVLKILQKSYNRKVKMIYIDPPYNTGNDFVYNDSFKNSIENYKEQTNQNNKANPDTSGRFHTDWLNMMYPRLKLAKNLLKDDGVIFISIDDNEIANLRIICDEIFGRKNFIAQCVRKRRDSQANLSKNISPIHEYIVIYAKSNSDTILNKVSANINENEYKNPDNDPRGPYKTMPCTNKGGSVYTVKTPTGLEITEEWRFKKETYDKLLNENKLVFPRGGDGKPRYKLFLSEKKEEGQLANTWWDNLSSNQVATKELKELFGDDVVFDAPKPTDLIEYCMQLSTNENDIVLDFFSGSATTAHSVMKRNIFHGKHLKYILVQLPEQLDDTNPLYNDGYNTICDIGEERIRRAGKKIKEENGLLAQDLDVGFKVFKLDSSNIKLWNGENIDINNANEYFYEHMDPIVEGRTEEDLLYEILLKEGMMLSSPIEEKNINGKKIYSVGMGYMIVCLNDDIDIELVREIGRLNPETVIFKDSGFVDENAKANALQELKKMGIEEERVKSI